MVGGEFGEQTIRFALDADHTHRRFKTQGRLEQSVNNEFGHRVHDADRKSAGTRRGAAGHHLEQFLPDAENLIRV
jgi:hypothetical protein